MARSQRSDARVVTVDGASRTLKEWAAHSGLSAHTIWYRLYTLQWSPERAVTSPKVRGAAGRPQRKVTVEGVTRTLREWAAHTGIPIGTISNRLTKGVPERLAVTTPAQRGCPTWGGTTWSRRTHIDPAEDHGRRCPSCAAGRAHAKPRTEGERKARWARETRARVAHEAKERWTFLAR